MEGANIVPVMDMNRNNNYGDCWGGGMWFMWIIVLFALMGGWGGNWNNRGNMGAEIFANGSMTRDQIADQFSMQDIKTVSAAFRTAYVTASMLRIALC